MLEIRNYSTAAGRDVFEEWLDSLKDETAAAKITTRINRLAGGNFGDCKSVGQGVWELRIDWGPGYRVYYSMIDRACILLLCAGDKRRQRSDIAKAVEYLLDYKRRRGSHER